MPAAWHVEQPIYAGVHEKEPNPPREHEGHHPGKHSMRAHLQTASEPMLPSAQGLERTQQEHYDKGHHR